ncbi:MAG: RNA polymerase sigma factor [Candidatus Dormibacteria bacterium]
MAEVGTEANQGSPEQELLRAATAGDRAAFEKLIAPLLGPGFGLARAMMGDPAEAEDVVQEAALKAWRKLHQVKPGLPVRPWFLGIVANQCRSTRRTRWWRMSRASGELELTEEARSGPGPEVIDLRRALGTLDQRARLLVVLRYYLDLPMEEVAAAAGIPVGTAKSGLSRALAKLRPGLDVGE